MNPRIHGFTEKKVKLYCKLQSFENIFPVNNDIKKKTELIKICSTSKQSKMK